MKIYIKLTFLFIITCCVIPKIKSARSILRPPDITIPEITTFWSDKHDTKHYSLKSVFFEEWALFQRFNKKYLLNQQLPEIITFRYEPTKKTTRETLSNLIEEFIQEINGLKRKTKIFKNVTIIKDRDFNYKTHSGLIIVKFKNYPFMVKLFMETPKSFTQPFSKGIEPTFFFIMGGGINRFLAGFTRISNLITINQKIAADPYWSTQLTTPRKWFWTPRNTRYFTVIGKNIGKIESQNIELPSIYAIICDAISTKRSLTIGNKKDRKLAIAITQFIGNNIDPHINNFVIEEHTNKIAIIDTEHFPSIVGLEQTMKFNYYSSWYWRLTKKFISDAMLQTKRARKKRQQRTAPTILAL